MKEKEKSNIMSFSFTKVVIYSKCYCNFSLLFCIMSKKNILSCFYYQPVISVLSNVYCPIFYSDAMIKLWLYPLWTFSIWICLTLISCKKNWIVNFPCLLLLWLTSPMESELIVFFVNKKKYTNFIVSFFSNDISKAHEIKN